MKWAKKLKTKNGQNMSSGPFPHDATHYFAFQHQVNIVMNKNQSKQVTGCSILIMVLDLHEIVLASNFTLKDHNFTPSKLKPLTIYSVFMERCNFFAP